MSEIIKDGITEIIAHYVANLEFNANVSDQWFLDACAMKSLPPLIELSFKDYKEMATIAYDIADAMLAERNKRRGMADE